MAKHQQSLASKQYAAIQKGFESGVYYFLRESEPGNVELAVDFSQNDNQSAVQFSNMICGLEKFGKVKYQSRQALIAVYNGTVVPKMLSWLRETYPTKETTPLEERPHLDELLQA